MKLLHTSDWHLGRMLYSKKERQAEHASFLEWLLNVIKEHSVDLLIVAGDIFDTASPGSSSQKIYYDFLLKVRNTCCKNVIIVGGNHDSPSFLNAPKEILAALNVCVIGNVTNNIEDEIVVIRDTRENPMAIVCAVPFLRERDISRFTEGESYSDRSKRIAQSIKNHYAWVAAAATGLREQLNKNIPIIATGHLSVAGGETTEGDGVREIYIGNIESVGKDIFPPVFDYVALGHYHISSVLAENIRYCGSPIPMGFGEAAQQKSVFIAEFNNNKPEIERLEIPVFQKLESIRGNKEFITNRLEKLITLDISVWIEIIYEGNEIFPDFTNWAYEKTANSKIEILKLHNQQYFNEVLTLEESSESLEELNNYEVFDKLLEKNNINDAQKEELQHLYQEIIVELNTES